VSATDSSSRSASPPPPYKWIENKVQIWQFFLQLQFWFLTRQAKLHYSLHHFQTFGRLFFSQIAYLFAILSFAHKLAQYLFFKTEIFHWSNSKALPFFLSNHRIPIPPFHSQTFPNTYHTVCVQMSYMYI
jgi:hypothetical protein